MQFCNVLPGGGTIVQMRVFVSVLIVCCAVTAFLVWRIVRLLPLAGGCHRGLVYALPLICILSGQFVGCAWSAWRGNPVGPWRWVAAEALFLATMLVAVSFG